MGAFVPMNVMWRGRRTQILPTLIGVAAIAVSLHGSIAQAAIQLPDQIGFSTTDLERALSTSASSGAGTSSGQSDSRQHSDDDNQERELLGLQDANLPSGGGSSGSSTNSSSSGGFSANAIGWLVNSTIAIRDDSPLGRLAEDHGLSLPDPPGTDLLRPPRGRV
jgi:hypothetical protein